MDSAILSATAGLVGSLIGAASSILASWLTQHDQLRAQTLVQEATKREALYAEFIVEAELDALCGLIDTEPRDCSS